MTSKTLTHVQPEDSSVAFSVLMTLVFLRGHMLIRRRLLAAPQEDGHWAKQGDKFLSKLWERCCPRRRAMALCAQGTMCVSVWAEGEPHTAKADA